MPSKCAHENVTTRFCPHCGEVTSKNVGYALITHCQQTLKTHQTRHDNLDKHIDHTPGDSLNGDSARWLCQAADKVEKWTAWVAWVQKRVECEESEAACGNAKGLLTDVANWLRGWIQNEKKPQDMDFADLEDRINAYLGDDPIAPFSFLKENHEQ